MTVFSTYTTWLEAAFGPSPPALTSHEETVTQTFLQPTEPFVPLLHIREEKGKSQHNWSPHKKQESSSWNQRTNAEPQTHDSLSQLVGLLNKSFLYNLKNTPLLCYSFQSSACKLQASVLLEEKGWGDVRRTVKKLK